MRFEGVNKKNLMSIHNVTEEQAKRVMRIARRIRIAESRDIDNALREINEELEGYGVEVVTSSSVWNKYWCDAVAIYVNFGDTYIPTVLYDIIRDRLIFTSWGDWYELAERKKFWQ